MIELNHASEDAGIQTGMSTSQAVARASELVLYNGAHRTNSISRIRCSNWCTVILP